MRWLKVKCCLSLLFTALLTTSTPAMAQSYPDRPIKMVVPFAPGGPVDVIGRILAKGLSDKLGQNVVVDNRPGASGALGTQQAAQSPPDGYTLLLGSTSTISILPATKEGVKYNPEKDLVPIGIAATGVHIFVVHPTVPVSDMKGLVAYARAQKSPLAVAAGGTGTPDDLASHLLEREAKIRLLHVPYKGTGPALADVVAGHIPMMAADSSAVLPYLKSGHLKALGIASVKRNPLVPDVPTLDEQGLHGFETGGWFGVFVPSGTPPAVVDLLSHRLVAVMAEPEIQAAIARTGLTALSIDATAAAPRLQKENEKWGKLIRDIKL